MATEDDVVVAARFRGPVVHRTRPVLLDAARACWPSSGCIWLAAQPDPERASPTRAWIALVLIVMVALQIYVSGSVESWTVAGSFGQRRFVALTPILALGLAVWTGKARAASGSAPRVLVGTLVPSSSGGTSVSWHSSVFTSWIGSGSALGRNARTTFVELPLEMPSLVARYFTDRASFYRQPRQDRE